MNRPLDFPVLVLSVLVAFVLLLSGSAIFSRAYVPRIGSGRTIARAVVEEPSLVQPHVVGLFSDPVEIKVSANYQQANPSVGFGLSNVTEKTSNVPGSPKNRKRPRGYRLMANLVNRIHARPVHLGERGLALKVAALWKEIGINERRLQKRLRIRCVLSSAVVPRGSTLWIQQSHVFVLTGLGRVKNGENVICPK